MCMDCHDDGYVYPDCDCLECNDWDYGDDYEYEEDCG